MVRISFASDTHICTKPSFWTELLLNIDSTQFKVTFPDESLIAGASSFSEQRSKLQIFIKELNRSSQDFGWNLQTRDLYNSYFGTDSSSQKGSVDLSKCSIMKFCAKIMSIEKYNITRAY